MMPFRSRCGALISLVAALVLAAVPVALIAGAAIASGNPPVDRIYESLNQIVRDTPVESMNQKWLFEKVYRGHPNRQVYLKKILGDTALAEKSAKMARMRQAVLLDFLSGVAKNKGWVMEITNQGKTIGHASDLDITAWVAGSGPKGAERFKAVVDMWHDYLGRKGLTEGIPDITMFNGDEFLPDWTNSKMGSKTFVKDLAKNIIELRRNKEAYYVPGANKEQTHNRALAEGRTYHVAWDRVSGQLLVNGKPFSVEAFIAGKQPLVPLRTRDVATRYHGVTAAQPWRNSMGNGIQNLDNMMSHTGDPYARQKYSNRIFNQSFSRVLEACKTGAMGEFQSYADVHFSEALNTAQGTKPLSRY